MSALLQIMKRDMLLAVRRRGGVLHSVIFCLMLVVMYPLAFGADSTLLQAIGAGVIWVAALLISTLNLPTLFEDDFEDDKPKDEKPPNEVNSQQTPTETFT